MERQELESGSCGAGPIRHGAAPQGTPVSDLWAVEESPGVLRPFSLFFAVTRVSETASANLKVGYAKVEAATTVRLPMDGKVHESVAPALPQIPVMWNERKIAANTKLTCTYDADLKQLTQAKAKKRAADLTADQRAQAKKKMKTEDESTDKAIK